MNKKQLIVAWVVVILICTLLLLAPKLYLMPHPAGGYIKMEKRTNDTITKIDWDFVLQNSLITLIIGGLSIYTLRDKKE